MFADMLLSVMSFFLSQAQKSPLVDAIRVALHMSTKYQTREGEFLLIPNLAFFAPTDESSHYGM